jgi:hypothetical protein
MGRDKLNNNLYTYKYLVVGSLYTREEIFRSWIRGDNSCKLKALGLRDRV